MARLSRVLAASSVLALAACRTAAPQPDSAPAGAPAGPALPPLQQIDAWEDARSLGGGALVEWAQASSSPPVRVRALLALARIQDPTTGTAISRALTDADASVRAEAAFAAGEMGLSWDPLPAAVRDALSKSVLDVEDAEHEGNVRLALLDALGKIATPAAVQRLADRLLDADAAVRARAAVSLGAATKRGGAVPAQALVDVSPLLRKDASADERFGAAYLLALSKAPAARPALLACVQDESADVRSQCARGLGDVGADADAVTLARLLADRDYRVAVEATRALAKLVGKCKGEVCPAVGALAALTDRAARFAKGDRAGGGQPLLALAQQGLPPAGRPVLVALRASLSTAIASASAGLVFDLGNLDCRLAAAMDRQTRALAEVLRCGFGRVSEERRLEVGLQELAQAPASDPTARAKAVMPFLSHASARVRLAALEVLQKTGSREPLDRIRPLISASDPVVAGAAAAAAGSLGDRQALAPIRALAAKVPTLPDIADNVAEGLTALKDPAVVPDLQTWLASPNAHVRSLAAQALTQLTGRAVEPPRVQGRPAPAFALSPEARVRIRTAHGDIEIRLRPDLAPRTSFNLSQLAKRGFFDKLTFHRVVPDFVAQGGDPRGDGEGGPGYTLRCEVGHLLYGRGTVGMALSGKDTGGSQFFITTSPQPHLDGRYTAFGEVTAGMDVVDGLLEGDEMGEVRAQP